MTITSRAVSVDLVLDLYLTMYCEIQHCTRASPSCILWNTCIFSFVTIADLRYVKRLDGSLLYDNIIFVESITVR